jgi:hypothetical protein
MRVFVCSNPRCQSVFDFSTGKCPVCGAATMPKEVNDGGDFAKKGNHLP